MGKSATAKRSDLEGVFIVSYIQRGQPGYVRATLALFAGAFITFAILYTTQPIMPELSRQFHISPAMSSLSLSFATAALAVSMLWVSGVSDQWGRKRLMAVSLFSSAALSILVAVAPNYPTLLALRAVQGVVLAGFPSIAMAYVNEEFHPSSAGMAMGLYVSGTSIGGMAGRIITGMVTDLSSWRIAVLVIGIMSMALATWFWFNLPRPAHFSPQKMGLQALVSRLSHAARDRILLGIYTLGFLLMGSFVTMYNYISYLLMSPPYHLSQTLVGFIFVVYLTGTFSSTWMGRAADSIGKSKALRISVTISIVGCLVTLFPSLLLKIVGLALFTFGFFGGHAIASGWVGQLAPSYRAQASSLYLLFYYAGSSIVGSAGGLFWSAYGWLGVVTIITALLIVAYGMDWVVTRAIRKRDAGPSA
jgi:MFS transporter, YNFM family, putative membrane transport protein